MTVRQDRLLLALDFGGTKLTAGLAASGERHWQAHRRVSSPPRNNAQSDLEIMMGLARDMLATAQAPLAAVGVSFGGLVNAAQGLVLLSHHVPGWEKVPLREWLEERLGVPVTVDNDANAGALGEHRFGAGQGCDSLMYITISTGVGGGWILNGRLWRGAEGMAGEIGHTVVDPNGPLCLCGKRGCVERLASGPYIAQRAREWLQAQPERGQILRALTRGDPSASSGQAPSIHSGQAPEAITARLVAQAAAQGDDLAWEALEVAAWGLGVGIGNAANRVNPERFVLGGGVTKAGQRFWEVVRRTAHETALPEVHFDVVPAALGDDAPLWGGVALAEDCL
jgi:glucokinase